MGRQRRAFTTRYTAVSTIPVIVSLLPEPLATLSREELARTTTVKDAFGRTCSGPLRRRSLTRSCG
jgi:hypothetical protein